MKDRQADRRGPPVRAAEGTHGLKCRSPREWLRFPTDIRDRGPTIGTQPLLRAPSWQVHTRIRRVFDRVASCNAQAVIRLDGPDGPENPRRRRGRPVGAARGGRRPRRGASLVTVEGSSDASWLSGGGEHFERRKASGFRGLSKCHLRRRPALIAFAGPCRRSSPYLLDMVGGGEEWPATLY